MADDDDSGTDVSEVESTDSSNKSSSNPDHGYQPEPLKNQNKPNPNGPRHQYNRTGSMVIKHRSNSSLGNHKDLLTKMSSRWGSIGGDELAGLDTESDNSDDANNDDPNKLKPNKSHRRKKSVTDELKLAEMEREALSKAFEQYIDPADNQDVDIDEWIMGLQKLNVQLGEGQQRQIFQFMDKDQSNFIEKNDFVTFCTQKFENEDLKQLQNPILDAVRQQNLHDRSNSNLMNPGLSQDWSAFDMHVLQQEMHAAMEVQLGAMEKEVKAEEEFERMRKERKEQDPTILQAENALEWTKYEVVTWLEQLGMERYCRYFAQESVDGAMLLEDMTQDMLESNLAVRTIHAKKIMREITILKKAVRGVTDKLLDESDFMCTHHIEDLEKKIAILQSKEELEKLKRQKETIKKFYEGELRKLKEEIIDLKVKGKRRKERKKSEISLPKPPMDDVNEDDILLTPNIGMGAAETIHEEQAHEIKEENQNETNMNDEKTNDDDGDNKEEEQKEENVQKEDTKRDEAESEEEDESSDDDDDESPKKLLGMSQPHLTRLHKQKDGPSPKQINRFLKDLHNKKQSNYDTFCIEDVETIMNWTNEEVAYWILSINFEQYAFAFYSLPIDGDMLIRDMNKESIIEDLGVMKIHSARILRQIDKLRRIIHEGFDEDVIDGVFIEPNKERPTIEQIESLQDAIDKLETEREELRQALDDNNEEESGYFAKKIQDLETELNELKEIKEKMENDMEAMKGEHSEQMENLNNTLNESNASNDSLRKELKTMKKELRRAKRGQNGDEDYEESEEESEEEKEEEATLQEIEITHSRAEIEEIIISEMQTNTEFGFEARALEWSPAEVCNWLKSIQFSPYMEVFFGAQILGDVLLQDLGSKMLKQFKVTSMHIPKLLRQIENLRKKVMDKGVSIVVSDGINDDPKQKKKEKKSSKKRSNNNKKIVNNDQMQKIMAEHQEKINELQRIDGEKNEQLQELETQFEEEKTVRIGYELELEKLKNEYEALAKSGSKQQIEKLENLISTIEESKIRTVRDLNDQLNSLRIGCRLMQKEIAFLKTKQGFHPIDSLVSTLGYSAPPKY